MNKEQISFKVVKQEKISLPTSLQANWQKELAVKLINSNSNQIHIDCTNWEFSCRDLRQLNSIIQKAGSSLAFIQSDVTQTIISASALGFRTISNPKRSVSPHEDSFPTRPTSEIEFHQGTLRAGDHLISEGDVLLLGDVNPGARISAKGNVMIWGRLRGIAHAGCEGETTAKITSLQLRPLQLRIAELIARGPEDKPEEGLAEQARIDKGKIVIEPAAIKALK